MGLPRLPGAYFTDDEKATLIRLYVTEKVPLSEICRRFELNNHCTLLSYLKKWGVTLRGSAIGNSSAGGFHASWYTRRKGPEHHRWNGGIRYMFGYRMVQAKDHPNVWKNGYIREHRLIVERHLRSTEPWHPALDESGFLRREWDVHHRDENKLNNTLSNLEPLLKADHAKHHLYGAESRVVLISRIAILERELTTLRTGCESCKLIPVVP